ncbi:hypothetical protein V1523DRAFT_440666 [Lipomyces doorenjongii]
MPDRQGGLSSPLEIESLPSSTGVEEISKAEEFRYLLNYQVLLDEVAFKKYALYTTLDFNFSALVREIEADSKWSPSMQLAKTIAILQFDTMISSASLRRGIQKNAAAFESISRSDITKIAVTWRKHSHGQRREKFSATSALLEAANKRRHQEELAAEASYKRQLLEKYRCCVKSCYFRISAKHLNDLNESINIGHATIHSLPPLIDPLPAKGTNNPGYADHPLAHPPSPAPYPQLPPQYWNQSASYPPLPANYYYPLMYSSIV